MLRPFTSRIITLALFIAVSALFVHGSARAAEPPTIAGSWMGVLEVQGAKLNLLLHIEPAKGGYSAKLDVPDQGAFGLPFSETSFDGVTLRCRADALGFAFEGKLEDGRLIGHWLQGGARLPVTFEPLRRSRPQEPEGELPYKQVEVEVVNPAATDVVLRGTLTIPQGEGPFPAVVLVSGSGPQDRNHEVFDHRPFLVLSDLLTRQGIAVLRYDDRGTAASTGELRGSTTADFADDAEAVFRFLRAHEATDPKRVGIAGLSEGGVIAPMIAARNEDVAFIVMLAGPSIRGKELLLAQSAAVAATVGSSPEQIEAARALNEKLYDFALSQPDAEHVAKNLRSFIEKLVEEGGAAAVGLSAEELLAAAAPLQTPWLHFFLGYDPAPALASVKCPVLALYGGKDVQVPAAMNSERLRRIFDESTVSNTVLIFDECNHLFQTAVSGAVGEYAQIEETMSPRVMKMIADWILSLR